MNGIERRVEIIYSSEVNGLQVKCTECEKNGDGSVFTIEEFFKCMKLDGRGNYNISFCVPWKFYTDANRIAEEIKKMAKTERRV